MVKKENTRIAVTVNKNELAGLEEITKKYKITKTQLVALCITSILAYQTGDSLGKAIIRKLEKRANKAVKRRYRQMTINDILKDLGGEDI